LRCDIPASGAIAATMPTGPESCASARLHCALQSCSLAIWSHRNDDARGRVVGLAAIGGNVSLSNEKVIAAIGVSDEDVAHIRLLIRKASAELSHPWRWGSDSRADLLIVDTSNFAGQMARSRAKVTGMRAVVVLEDGADAEGDPAFYRPFKPENIVNVLNQAIDTSESLRSRVRAGSEFFQSQPREFEVDGNQEDLRLINQEADSRSSAADVAPGLDELLRDNPLANPRLAPNPLRFDQNSDIDGSGDPTRRSELRSDRDRESLAIPLSEISAARIPAKKLNDEDQSRHRLREYLEGALLGGPVQVAWEDSGVLTLDPKNHVFHCADPLRGLEIYCKESLRRSDWHRLTTAELAEIRETQPARPYTLLVWLDVLLQSSGRLASNLDPGGTFSLTQMLEIARDYPAHARISAALMRPTRLHEIAASCGCEMGTVFDVVNAYDAIGWLKWTPRPSRHFEEAPKKSLLSRLRNPFGKS
jgi:hypothetical protein